MAASALSVQGSSVIQRRQSSWILAVSQICISGHLISKIFISEEHGLIEFLVSMVFYFIGNFFVKRMKLNDSALLCLFVAFMAINYQLIALFPMLDSHLASSLFGDIATLSNISSYLLSAFSLFYLLGYALSFKSQLQHLIAQTYFSDSGSISLVKKLQSFFIHLFFIFCLFELGFLFVLAFLLIPTQMLKNATSSFKNLLILNITLSFLASGLGLLMSLNWTRLSTMPTQICLLVIFCVMVLLGKSLRRCTHQNSGI